MRGASFVSSRTVCLQGAVSGRALRREAWLLSPRLRQDTDVTRRGCESLGRCPFKLVSWGEWRHHGINVLFDTGVDTKGCVIGMFLIVQWVRGCLRSHESSCQHGGRWASWALRPLQTSLLWDTATLSPFLTSISHPAINYWSLELSKKRATYPENKLNLSTPPNWKHIIALDNALCV